MTGQLQATAEANIVAAGLTVGTVTTAASATVPAGDVISQNPVACMACASPSDPVDLVVSTGPIDIPDACLDAWPEDTVETIGGGQSPTNNPKVSQSITGNIVGGAEAYGEKASRIKICAGSFVTIVINDSTGTPTVTELSPGIGCGAGGCSVISLTATEKYKVKSNDGKDTDRITLLPQ